jgi:hypothetical protein
MMRRFGVFVLQNIVILFLVAAIITLIISANYITSSGINNSSIIGIFFFASIIWLMSLTLLLYIYLAYGKKKNINRFKNGNGAYIIPYNRFPSRIAYLLMMSLVVLTPFGVTLIFFAATSNIMSEGAGLANSASGGINIENAVSAYNIFDMFIAIISLLGTGVFVKYLLKGAKSNRENYKKGAFLSIDLRGIHSVGAFPFSIPWNIVSSVVVKSKTGQRFIVVEGEQRLSEIRADLINDLKKLDGFPDWEGFIIEPSLLPVTLDELHRAMVAVHNASKS